MNIEQDLFANPKKIEPALENNPRPKKDLRDAARKWIVEHPRTMRFINHFAKEMVAKKKKFGVKLLIERVRWEHLIQGGDDRFKVNNNHTAYIARWIIQVIPAAEEFLSFRETRY